MLLAEVSNGRFNWVDWAVIATYILFTTALGILLSGKQATIRDFFLGGRKLPWLAVCGSTIATEVSTATFVVVPAIVFTQGGNLTYLQLAIGSILARIIVGFYFVPRYYEHEIYSPYDYVGRRLGTRVKTTTTALFMIGAVLGQGARLYTTAFVLSVIADIDLITSIWVMGMFSMLWAMVGGITSVIWTDIAQCGMLLLGAGVTLWYALTAVPASLSEVIDHARAAGKFQLFDFRTNPSLTYTFWAGLLATPFANLAAFGTDQVMAQRMFCCKNQRDARKAVIFSSVSICITVVMMFVGIALFAYFSHFPLTGRDAELYDRNKENILPIFVTRALPAGVRGVVVAAVFAAAISSSAMAALAQTTCAPAIRFLKKVRGPDAAAMPSEIAVSKLLVFFWGIVLCLMGTASIYIARNYANAIDLVLALSGYTYGPLLGIFLLAFLAAPRDDAGLPWAVPMTVLAVFAMSVHVQWATYTLYGLCGAIILSAFVFLAKSPPRIVAVFLGVAVILALHHLKLGTDAAGKPIYLAFTWSWPIGTIMTFTLAYALGHPAAARLVESPPETRAPARRSS